MQSVASLALLAGAAVALRKPASLAGSHHAVAALSKRGVGPEEDGLDHGVHTHGPPQFEGVHYAGSSPNALQKIPKRGSIKRGKIEGSIIGITLGATAPLGAQGIWPAKDAAINGALFGLAAGLFEWMYQWYLKLASKPGDYPYSEWARGFYDKMVASASFGALYGAGWGALVGLIKKEVLNATTSCMKQEVQEPFDLDAYISAPWYPQWQNPQAYQEADALSCTSAVYTKRDNSKWSVNVNNTGGWSLGNDAEKSDTGGFLCASQQSGAKLVVGPCDLLPSMGGPYWVIKYSEGPGLAHAVIIGGQPNDADPNGICGYTLHKQNGMWIFTRKRVLDGAEEAELQAVKNWMRDARALDTARLLRTPQHSCR